MSAEEIGLESRIGSNQSKHFDTMVVDNKYNQCILWLREHLLSISIHLINAAAAPLKFTILHCIYGPKIEWVKR